MKKVLFISYYYPPLGGVGAQRAIRFIKYLPAYGWEPYVLTAEPSPYFPIDEVPINILPPERVRRAEVLEPLNLLPRPLKSRSTRNETQEKIDNPRFLKEKFGEIPLSWRGKLRAWLFIPDDRIGWIPEGTREGLGFLEKEKFDCLISTSAPYSAHLIAWRIVKRKHIPWVADFRDLWSTNPFLYFPTKWHQSLNSYLERKVVIDADCVLTCTPSFREDFLLRYSQLPAEKFVTITNGYDPEDFPPPDPMPYEKFTISYIGDLYGPQSPLYFLLGLKGWLMRNPSIKEKIQVFFVGPFENRVKPLVDSLELDDVVQLLGFLPHEQCVAVMRRSSILLLILGTRPGAEGIYPAKIFEYLAAKKPILGLVPEGLTKALLKESGVAFLVNPASEDSIALSLEKIYQAYRAGALPQNIEPLNLKQYNAQELTKNLAELVENILEKRRRMASLKGEI